MAIDEFQVIADYPDNKVEAVLRTRIQKCQNTWFVYSGSQRHMMSEIFVSPSRPFYQSTSLMSIEPIDCEKYVAFAQGLFRECNKEINREAIVAVYKRYEGVTWYVQSVLNALFTITEPGESCTEEMIDLAIQQIITQQGFAYKALLFQLPPKQKEVLMAICKEGKATNLTSRPFLQRYHLTASMVQGAVNPTLTPILCFSSCHRYSSLFDYFTVYYKLLFFSRRAFSCIPASRRCPPPPSSACCIA